MKKISKRKKRRIILWSVFSLVTLFGIVYAFFKFDVWKMTQDAINAPAFTVPNGWIKYQNNDYHFSFYYPSNWNISTTSALGDIPGIIIGNPIEGTSTYTMYISIKHNDNLLNSDAYVMQMLSDIKNQDLLDIKNSSNTTPSSELSAQYANASGISLNNNKEYELYNVFEFDHNSEQVFAAHKNIVLLFDFPLDQSNPNISNPSLNNATAHEILNTLAFSN
jgi:hypothetical protein